MFEGKNLGEEHLRSGEKDSVPFSKYFKTDQVCPPLKRRSDDYIQTFLGKSRFNAEKSHVTVQKFTFSNVNITKNKAVAAIAKVYHCLVRKNDGLAALAGS